MLALYQRTLLAFYKILNHNYKCLEVKNNRYQLIVTWKTVNTLFELGYINLKRSPNKDISAQGFVFK